MNRSIALFVALAALVAHILAIHNDGTGSLAFPYDQAHAAYRLARNLVLEGQLQWNPGSTAFESYSSPLWVGICTVGERLCATRFNANTDLISINIFCQTIGVLAMLACVALSAQFRPERAASLIAPLILVTSGCIAAAAANGLETALFTLFAVGSFLAFERAKSVQLACYASLLCLTRPEGVLFVAALAFVRPFARTVVVGEESRSRSSWPLVFAAAVFAATCLLRFLATGNVLPPSFVAVLHPADGQVQDGLAYVGDFIRTCPAVLLTALPVGLLFARRFSGTGLRALALASAWLVGVVLQGRAPLPFAELCVPALPFLGIAIQEGLIVVLDAPSLALRRAGLGAFALSLVATALPSGEPSDIGPIPLERWEHAWLMSSGSARFGSTQALGRAGLVEEIENTHLLRGVGVFFRDRVDPGASVLTPWPGAMGYLSRATLYDACGRASSIAGSDVPNPWSRRARVDLVAAFQNEPQYDFIVPLLARDERVPSPDELAQLWLDELDVHPEETGRLAVLEAQFAQYELVTIPVAVDSRSEGAKRDSHFLLMRRKSLNLAPRVELALEDDTFTVRLRHRTHQQLADLCVEAVDERGRVSWLRPTGEFDPVGPRSARSEMLLYDTGARTIDAIRAARPTTLDGARVVQLRAYLVNPDARGDQAFSRASAVATLSL